MTITTPYIESARAWDAMTVQDVACTATGCGAAATRVVGLKHSGLTSCAEYGPALLCPKHHAVIWEHVRASVELARTLHAACPLCQHPLTTEEDFIAYDRSL